ncbi:meiotically up-regulated gene family-domain-containing protein [Mortierella sp. GBAus27b]|nr:hypothetical protein BGX31_000102 [Mortierella sp. GBA43]KAI8355214.1 meiotically up-regulated gene family-domain-containing protein [Mortierella sp. GBAus27b]
MAKSFALLAVTAIATLSAGVMGYNDNCHGSGRCNKNMEFTCRQAINRFTDGTTYNGYTSRVFGDCTAIYHCDGAYPNQTGAQLKSQFDVIYRGIGCKGCGSHAFNSGKCEVTVNFCSNCQDGGNPN